MLEQSRKSVPLPTMKIVESDTGQKTEQLIGPDLSTGRALDIGREEKEK